MKLRITLLAAISVLLLASCSLAADVTPPPGFENADTNPQPVAGPTTEAVVPQDSGLGYPTTLPSVAKGASIYAQNCTRCHGPSGRGDGPMSSQIEFPLPDFTDSDLAFKGNYVLQGNYNVDVQCADSVLALDRCASDYDVIDIGFSEFEADFLEVVEDHGITPSGRFALSTFSIASFGRVPPTGANGSNS